MKIISKTILTAFLQLSFALVVSAQSKSAANTLQAPPADVKVDGDIKEWGDSLRYYNEERRLNYTLANDKENIYMAIRFSDRTEQLRVLNAGLTFGIDPKGKKKETFALNYPAPIAGETPHLPMHKPGDDDKSGDNKITQADRDELVRERLTKLRNIKVVGFKDIEGDMITTTNTYGIKAAVNYDADGYLVYEISIPLKFFGDFKPDKDEWAFQFKINGITRGEPGKEGGERPAGSGGGMGGGMGGGGMRGGGGMGGGRGGRGAGMRGGGGGAQGGQTSMDRSELFKSVDFWEKYFLRRD